MYAIRSYYEFNFPAYTLETLADVPVRVRWINDLVDANGGYLPPLFTVDQTLHWANPPQDSYNFV